MASGTENGASPDDLLGYIVTFGFIGLELLYELLESLLVGVINCSEKFEGRIPAKAISANPNKSSPVIGDGGIAYIFVIADRSSGMVVGEEEVVIDEKKEIKISITSVEFENISGREVSSVVRAASSSVRVVIASVRR